MTKIEASVLNKSPRTGERGVALIIALLAMTVIAGLGMTLLVSSSTESLINASFRRAGMAHFSALGGVEELRGRMGPDARPVALDLTSVRIPCGTPATCPPLFNETSVASGGVPARSTDLRTGYYIRINNTIDPASTTCTYLVTGDCYDSDILNRPTAPVYFTTSQPGTAMPYVWVKVQVATQRRLKRNLLLPCNPSDPSSPDYCDPTALDNTLMVCWDGQQPVIAEDIDLGNPDVATLPDPTVCGDPVNPLLIFTSLSIQPGGGLRLVRELAALGKTPTLPGGLVLDGCPVNVGAGWPTTTNFDIDGMDASPTGNDDSHAVVTRCAADMAEIHTRIPDGVGGTCNPAFTAYAPPSTPGCQAGNNRNDNYPGIGNSNCSSPNCNNTPESADVYYDPNLATDPVLGTCSGLNGLVDSIRDVAYQYGYVYPAGTTNIPTPGDGSDSDPNNWDRVINVITGDATLGQADFGSPGAGIILIEGNLTLNGYPSYNGLILIIGTGQVTITGGGNGVMNGGIIIANTTTCDPITDAPGPITFDQPGGATFELHYNSDAITPLNGTLPVQKLSVNY